MAAIGDEILPDTRAGERKTLALLLDYMNLSGAGYEVQIRDSFDARCRELDLNLLLFYGRGLGESHPAAAAHNSIYELVLSERVDAVIILSASLARDTSGQLVTDFVQRYSDKPVCCVGTPVPGVANVVVDATGALAETIEHLIVQHGKRRLAFVCGPKDNSEARHRLRVFTEVLARYGLEQHPERVLPGDFVESGGAQAAERLVASGVPFDAVVAANDSMALGVVDSLRRHGFRVPVDVAVTGFDDLTVASQGNPPLTTVAQPFAAIAQSAIDVVLEQLVGRSVPAVVSLPASVVVRRSCGCGSRAAAAATLGTIDGLDAGEPPSLAQIARDPKLETALSKSLFQAYSKSRDPRGRSLGRHEAKRLLSALREEFAGRTGRFLEELEESLGRVPRDLETGHALRDAMNLLREAFRKHASLRLEDMWHDAGDMIALAETTWQSRRRMSQDRLSERFLSVSERLSLALDMESLQRALKESLPPMGLRTAFISHYASANSSLLEPLLSLVDGREVEVSTSSFPERQLLPNGALPEHRRITALIFPLVFETQRLGVGVFEYDDELIAYPMVRDRVSAALRSVALKEEVMQKTLLHERSVQERLATRKRMQALSVLAGGVAHDLNNTLGPLVGLPDILLGQLESLNLEPRRLQSLAADLTAIRFAAQRTSQTVKNLLTLGREGRTPKVNVDLNAVVARCLDSDSLRLLREANATVDVEIEQSGQPLIVAGAESQLERAISNLVRNAMEATSGRGKVVLRTREEHLGAVRESYEAVPPGDYAVLSVSDQGSGIEREDLARVFEPFFSKKKSKERSGTGLGLAIVHSVVKEHDGFVDVDSQIDQGTTFTLYLPRAPGKVSLVPDSSEAPAGRARILIVDDEPMQLRTATRLLGHLGYHVETAPDARQALDKFTRSVEMVSPYDLVIVDVILGDECDGLQLFERMQALFPQQKALLVSGHAPADRMELAQARGLPWLPKPYSIESLAQAVRTALPAHAAKLEPGS